MRTVKVIFVAVGETFTAHVQVRSEYLADERGRKRLKDILESTWSRTSWRNRNELLPGYVLLPTSRVNLACDIPEVAKAAYGVPYWSTFSTFGSFRRAIGSSSIPDRFQQRSSPICPDWSVLVHNPWKENQQLKRLVEVQKRNIDQPRTRSVYKTKS